MAIPTCNAHTMRPVYDLMHVAIMHMDEHCKELVTISDRLAKWWRHTMCIHVKLQCPIYVEETAFVA